MAGIKITHVPYKGSGPALNDLVAGHVDIMFGELAPSYPHVQAGKLKALAVSGDKRVAALPERADGERGAAGLRRDIVVGHRGAARDTAGDRQSDSAAVGETMKQPDVAKRLNEMSMVSTGSNAADFSKFIKAEAERWGNVIRISGAKAQ